MGLVNAIGVAYCVFVGMRWDFSKFFEMYFLCLRWHGIGMVNTYWEELCVLVSMVTDRSTHVMINFVSLLAWYNFGNHMLRYILCPRWHGRGLVNTCWDEYCAPSGMGLVYRTHVEMHLVSLLAWDVFCRHMLKYIFCPRWRGLVNIFWYTFWDFFLAFEGFCQQKLRCIFVS